MEAHSLWFMLMNISFFALLLVFLIGSIDLLTPLWTDHHRAPHHVRYTTGIVMAFGVVDCAYWAAISLSIIDASASEILLRIGGCFDLLLLLNTFLIGEAILYGKDYTAKRVWLYIIPSLIAALFYLITGTLWLLYVFFAYAVICVIVQMVRHIKAHARPWIITCMVLLFVQLAGYTIYTCYTEMHEIPKIWQDIYFTVHDLLSAIVWMTILIRIIRYDEKEKIESDISNV